MKTGAKQTLSFTLTVILIRVINTNMYHFSKQIRIDQSMNLFLDVVETKSFPVIIFDYL